MSYPCTWLPHPWVAIWQHLRQNTLRKILRTHVTKKYIETGTIHVHDWSYIQWNPTPYRHPWKHPSINIIETSSGPDAFTYVGCSSKIQALSHDSSSSKIEVYSNGKTRRLLKSVFKCAGILLTSIYITQQVLASPTLTGTWFYEYH